MDTAMLIIWSLFAVLSFVAAMKFEKPFCLYLIAGFAAAGFMAFIGAPLILQLALGVNTVVIAILNFEFGMHNVFMIFAVIEILIILAGIIFR